MHNLSKRGSAGCEVGVQRITEVIIRFTRLTPRSRLSAVIRVYPFYLPNILSFTSQTQFIDNSKINRFANREKRAYTNKPYTKTILKCTENSCYDTNTKQIILNARLIEEIARQTCICNKKKTMCKLKLKTFFQQIN